MIFFVDKYWPEFSYKDFMIILIRYNIDHNSHLKKLKNLEVIHKFPILT